MDSSENKEKPEKKRITKKIRWRKKEQ